MKDSPRLHPIDQACIGYFDSLGINPEGAEEHHIVLRDTELSLGMTAIHITYRDQMHPYDNLAEVNPSRMGMGKPSVEIRTRGAEGGDAVYNFHRSLGLVIVNDFDFPMGEVRSLRASEKKKIDASIETRGSYDNLMSRVMKSVGLPRIVADIDLVTASLGLYGLELSGDAGIFIDSESGTVLS